MTFYPFDHIRRLCVCRYWSPSVMTYKLKPGNKRVEIVNDEIELFMNNKTNAGNLNISFSETCSWLVDSRLKCELYES